MIFHVNIYCEITCGQVADCVCLMAMDKLEAVPVDTHVWQLTLRDYRKSGVSSAKSLTDTIYKQVGKIDYVIGQQLMSGFLL